MEKITVNNINVVLLKEQRDHLLELIKELDPNNENNTGYTLQGVINLFDHMLDHSSDNPEYKPVDSKVIVRNRGGLVQEVIHNIEGLEVVILDGDVEDCATEDLMYFEDDVYYGYSGQVDVHSPERCEAFNPEDKVDLFKHLSWLPDEVREIAEVIVNNPDESFEYRECKGLQERMEELGYTFEYGLDGIPFGLKEIS